MRREERSDRHDEGTETREDAAKIIGGGDYAAPGEDEPAPPGGDVRTVYTQDRDPGSPEPEAPQST
jgi:hypothetical protein